MSTYRAVKAEIQKLEKQAADLLQKELAVVVSKVKAQIAEYGLTAADLGFAGKTAKAPKGKRPRAAAKPAGVPVYADPKSGKTWTGKGKPPLWIAGKSRESFLINKSAAVSVAAAKPVKAANSAKAAKPVKAPKVAKVGKPAAVKAVAASPKAAKKAGAKPVAKVAKKASAKVAANAPAKKVGAKPAAPLAAPAAAA